MILGKFFFFFPNNAFIFSLWTAFNVFIPRIPQAKVKQSIPHLNWANRTMSWLVKYALGKKKSFSALIKSYCKWWNPVPTEASSLPGRHFEPQPRVPWLPEMRGLRSRTSHSQLLAVKSGSVGRWFQRSRLSSSSLWWVRITMGIPIMRCVFKNGGRDFKNLFHIKTS